MPDNDVQNEIEMKKQTLHKASKFFVCRQEPFPGEDFLSKWVTKKAGV